MISLEAGDIVWVDFDPVLGTEQAGRRPAIVLSLMPYHERSKRAVVCPIQSVADKMPVAVRPEDERLNPGGSDSGGGPRRARFPVHQKAPDDVLQTVRDRVSIAC